MPSSVRRWQDIPYRNLCSYLGLIVILIVPRNVCTQPNKIIFEHISVEEGLSNSYVRCFLQDAQGFMWIGTEDGLNLFDGYKFTPYDYDDRDSNSFARRPIVGLCEDRENDIWVVTGRSVSRYVRAQGRFCHYSHDSTNPRSLSEGQYSFLYKDFNGQIWVASAGGGLNLYDREHDQFKHYRHDEHDSTSLYSDMVRCITEDQSGTYWIGTDNGLERFDLSENKFVHYWTESTPHQSTLGSSVNALMEDSRRRLWVSVWGKGIVRLDRERLKSTRYKSDPGNPSGLSDKWVNQFYEDSRSNIWLATNGEGMNWYDEAHDRFVSYRHDELNPKSLSSDRIYSLYEDKGGVLWIGTILGGPDRYDRRKGQFNRYVHGANDPSSIGPGGVSALYQDRFGTLWVGTDAGLSAYDSASGRFMNFNHDPKNNSSISRSGVKAIAEDRWGRLWFGTNHGGLNRYDPREKRFVHYQFEPKEPKSLGNDEVRAITKTKDGNLWIATTGGGLDRYDRSLDGFIHYRHDRANSHSLGSDNLSTLFEDSHGQLWIGTFGQGLDMFDREKNQFVHYRNRTNDTTSLSNNIIVAMNEDTTEYGDDLWVATYGGGLNRFKRRDDTFIHYTKKEGLGANIVKGLLFDAHENLWISTDNGLTKFDPRAKTFHIFDKGDGLPFVDFASRSYCQTRNGQMVFGGWEGFIAFYPDSLTPNLHPPPMVITNFKKFDKDVQFDKPISDIKQIELSYDDDFFSFEFAALDYTFPQKNQYAYMMERFDKDWIYAGTRRYAAYTHLDPGRYVFRIKGSNNDGIWNEAGISLTIIIAPPYWQTWWFRILVGTALLGAIGLLYNRRITGLKKEKFDQQQFSRKLIDSQEAERKRVAAELHDGLGQDLLIVNNELQQYLHGQDGAKGDLEHVSAVIKESIDVVREISSNLHPHYLDRLGLKAALETIIEKVSRATDISFSVSIDDIDNLFMKEVEINVYRMVQEALSNIIRHSHAAQASLSVRKNRDVIIVEIRDDGKGFRTGQRLDSTQQRQGFGLSSMLERTKLIGGTLTIDSQLGEGSTLSITIPLTAMR